MSVLYIDTTNCLENIYENIYKINIPTNNDNIILDNNTIINDHDKFKKSLENCNKIIVFTIL